MRSTRGIILIAALVVVVVALAAWRIVRSIGRESPARRAVAAALPNMPADASGRIPLLLSETGAFKDLRTLTPADNLVHYEMNLPFWSDGAEKHRWMALPRGTKIHFAAIGEWKFPPGAAIVKHFEVNGRRLETRFIIVQDDGGVYAVSYKWRSDNSDADLNTKDRIEALHPAPGSPQSAGNWFFPAPQSCMACHTRQAGGVLGLSTRQLNHDIATADGRRENQLVRWSRAGLLDADLQPAQVAGFPKLAGKNDSSVSLEQRARSYLDANCAYCHRPGSVLSAFDARYETPLSQQKIINGDVMIDLGIDNARIVVPGDARRSMLLARIDTNEAHRMPPLARLKIDKEGVELIRQWILSLPAHRGPDPSKIQPSALEIPPAEHDNTSRR